MALSYERVMSVVKRLVNAGPLSLLPKKRGDQTVLLALACARFDSARVYREDDVNDTLQAWLEAVHVADHDGPRIVSPADSSMSTFCCAMPRVLRIA